MKKFLIDYPNLVEEWDFTKNADLDITKIRHGSKHKVWWRGKCGHEFQARIDGRTGRGSGCPYCNRNRKDDPLIITHPGLVKEWHPKNSKQPNQITSGCHERVWWLCSQGHEWEAHVHNRSSGWDKGWGCPYCSNKRVSNTNSLATMRPRIASEFHPTKNGELTAASINYRTYQEVWWLAACGHEWRTAVHTRTRDNRPANCPFCFISQGELRIEEILKNLGIQYKRQVRFDSCRDKKPLPFDFWVQVNGKEWLIEYQGIQHFEATNFGGDYLATFDVVKQHDNMKQDWCLQNNLSLLLISYLDFDRIENILKSTILSKA